MSGSWEKSGGEGDGRGSDSGSSYVSGDVSGARRILRVWAGWRSLGKSTSFILVTATREEKSVTGQPICDCFEQALQGARKNSISGRSGEMKYSTGGLWGTVVRSGLSRLEYRVNEE